MNSDEPHQIVPNDTRTWLDLYREIEGLRADLAKAERDRDDAAAEARMGHVRLDECSARMGHVRLDECSDASETWGKPLYDRISEKIQKFVDLAMEREHIIKAIAAEKDVLRARAEAARERQAAAEYRAQRMEAIVSGLLECNQGVWSHSEQGRKYILRCQQALKGDL